MRRHSLLIFSFINFFGLIFIWLLQNFIGERTGLTALLTYFPQHGFGVLSIILLVCALYMRRIQILALNAASFLLFAFGLLGFQLPSLALGNQKTVRVMTYNVRGVFSSSDKIASDIRAQNPDVVCLQETSHGFGEAVAAHFSGWHSESAGDVTTFSRYPLLSSEVWPFKGTRRIVETRWQTPNGPLRVLNVHVSTSFRGDNHSRVKGRFDRYSRLINEARPAAMVRLQQIPYLEDASNETERKTEPTIMCGDFNTPPRGLFYKELKRNWHEAFAQSGFGIGATYPTHRPLLRIDYVWMKNGVQSKRTFVPDVNGSDHLPVVSDLVLQE